MSRGFLVRRLVVACAVVLLAACGTPMQQIREAEHEGNAAALVELLQHGGYSYIREHAAGSLGSIPAAQRSEKAYEALVGALRKPDENPYVKVACGITLMRWKAKKSVPDLVDATFNTADPEARYWLAWALHHFKHPDATAALERLREDPDLLLATSAREWMGCAP